MKRWALVVAALYFLILAVLTLPVLVASFGTTFGWEVFGVYATWPYWIWIAIMVVSQFALLSVPVRVASLRPVSKGALWPTVLAGGLMAGALVVGAVFSITEFFIRDKGASDWLVLSAFGLGLASWAAWSVIFFRAGWKGDPTDMVSHQCRLLLKGSILELLIAVPTHVVARYRHYCCAGFMTFFGLTMGISVMLFSFGPSVFFLFAARWKRLHPERTGNELAV